MKKRIIYLVCSILIIALGITIFKVSNIEKKPSEKVVTAQVDLNLNCKSSILLEASTGKILYNQNENEKLPMASMTKMMGLIIVCEAIANNQISLDDKVTISNEAASMGGSQVFLEAQEVMSVDELLKCVCIASANDAMYALSELVSVSNQAFIDRMNDKAKEMGLQNTNFINVTGFDDPNHYSSALDMAMIGKELLKYEDMILKYTSIYDDYIRKDSPSPFWLVNTNRMVKYYEGMDGLKTGYTNKSGFCLTATAKRNDVRLISVIMGAPTSSIRNSMTSKLLDFGFAKVKKIKLYNSGDVITQISINKAKKEQYDVFAKDDICFISTEKIDQNNIKKEIIFNELIAPMKQNDIVGKIKISVNDECYEYDLILNEDVELLTFKELFIEYFKELI